MGTIRVSFSSFGAIFGATLFLLGNWLAKVFLNGSSIHDELFNSTFVIPILGFSIICFWKFAWMFTDKYLESNNLGSKISFVMLFLFFGAVIPCYILVDMFKVVF